MPTFSIDTSCMVAAVCAWHEHHAAARRGIERRLDRGEGMAIAAHALVETYAVLTRLPAPHRLAPADAWALVEANFAGPAGVITLNGPAYVALLRRVATRGIGGGRVYDEVIGACAAHAKVDALLTFNPRHFDPKPEHVAVIDPLH